MGLFWRAALSLLGQISRLASLRIKEERKAQPPGLPAVPSSEEDEARLRGLQRSQASFIS